MSPKSTRFLLSESPFHCDLFGVRRRRNRVRHIDHGCDAATCRCCRSCSEVFFIGETRLSKMHMSIDQPWKNVLIPGVNDFFAVGEGIIDSDSNKFPIRYGNAAFESFLRCDHPTALNDEIGFHPFTLMRIEN